MAHPDRRACLAGAGALLASGPAFASAPGAGDHDYLFLDLAAGPDVRRRGGFEADLKASGRAILEAAGGDILGIFGPALGWRSDQLAVLVAWRADARDRDAALKRLTAAPSIRSAAMERLQATARPLAGERPQPGGAHVHRWFAVEPQSVARFVALSAEGWRDYEGQFDTQVYGLFEVHRSRRDRQDGLTRLLLITRYRDHAAWEESRDPSAAARVAFNQRQKFVRHSWAASTRLVR